MIFVVHWCCKCNHWRNFLSVTYFISSWSSSYSFVSKHGRQNRPICQYFSWMYNFSYGTRSGRRQVVPRCFSGFRIFIGLIGLPWRAQLSSEPFVTTRPASLHFSTDCLYTASDHSIFFARQTPPLSSSHPADFACSWPWWTTWIYHYPYFFPLVFSYWFLWIGGFCLELWVMAPNIRTHLHWNL